MNNKYNAKKVIVNGLVFDSKKEANRYQELLLLERAGEITRLERQVSYELIPAQYEEVVVINKLHRQKKKRKLVERSTSYKADFVYHDKQGNLVVEDVKGYRNSAAYAIFVIKRKLMLQVYGIKVREI